MQIIVEKIENPNGVFWIWNKEITNKQEGRKCPVTTSNVGSGISVAVYQKDEYDNIKQIAQLQLPDYKKLSEFYLSSKQINLDYTYIDDFTWLGNKKPYEVEGLSYNDREELSARCSMFNNFGDDNYLHIMQSEIKKGDVDFSYSGFFNLNLDLCNLNIKQGNLIFSSAHFYNSNISVGMIRCGGTQLFYPEISFRYIVANNAKIYAMMMPQKLSIDFLCAKTNNTTISLDSLPATFNVICFVKAIVSNVVITNAEIDVVDIGEADICYLKFDRCKFLDYAEINSHIHELHIDHCLNKTIFKLSLFLPQKITFSGTINSGKICFTDFISTIPKLVAASSGDAEQLLMLKENFRQTGEYENEDICHLFYRKLKTKCERNILKKLGLYIIDGISGYGTKPFRMLIVILVTIVLFGTLYYFVPYLSFHGVNTWLEHIYASGITFFAVGYGDLFPHNILTKMVSLVEALLGVTSTSYFLVLLSRKVIR